MSRIRVVGLALVAVFAFSAVVAASASASSFLASKEGLLLGKASGPQKFITSAGEVECKALRAHGKVVSTQALKQKVTVEYTNCKAFGALTAVVSGAEYEFNADGTVAILNTIAVSGNGCTVKVGSEGNGNLSEVSYVNSGGLTIIKSKVTLILYLTTAGCPGGAKHLRNGSYSGNATSELHGGTVKWDQE
jgi:hypothetical protein